MQLVGTDLSCTVLPGRYRSGENIPELYNSFYRYWCKTWGDVLTACGNPGALNAENFLRQDLIVILHQGFEIAGAISSSYFNLAAEPIYDHPYLKAFPSELMDSFRAKKVGHIISGEYLSVAPGFRKSTTDAPLSDILIGLLMKVFVQSEAKMTLATTIKPAKVHKIGEKYGWSELGSFNKYGLDCVLLCNSRQPSSCPICRRILEF
jgi:hypothetical protein